MPAGTSAPWEAVNMPAVDLRRLVGAAVTNEGVQGDADLKVTQRGAGANMSVDVAPGISYVKDDHAGGDGYYFLRVASTENIAVSAADPSNPRIDRVGYRIRDTNLGDAADDWTLQVLAGTPTSGANLTNLTGAQAIPSNWLLLANVVVGASDTSITNSEIDTTWGLVRPKMLIGAGGELDYAQQTSNQTSTATTEGTATAIITGNTRAYEARKVNIEVFFPKAHHSAGNVAVTLVVKRGATVVGQINVPSTTTAPAGGFHATVQDTPSASSFAYSVACFVASGTATFSAGAGASGNLVPMHLRVTLA